MEIGLQFNVWPGGPVTVVRLVWKRGDTCGVHMSAVPGTTSVARGFEAAPYSSAPSHAARENLEPSIPLALPLAFSQ